MRKGPAYQIPLKPFVISIRRYSLSLMGTNGNVHVQVRLTVSLQGIHKKITVGRTAERKCRPVRTFGLGAVVAAIVEKGQEFHTTRSNGSSRLDISRYDAAIDARVGQPIPEARSRPRTGFSKVPDL
jgi:hypothetical protein